MLILTPFLLFTFGVLASATDDNFCKNPPDHCSRHVELDIPDDEEDLDKLCPILIPAVKCLLDFIDECSDKVLQPDIKKGILEKGYALLLEACDKESDLHKQLVSHLPCITEVVMSHRRTCGPIVKEAQDELISDLNIDFKEGDSEEDDEDKLAKFECMSASLFASCFQATTSLKCGEKPGEMVGYVIDQLSILDIVCPENIREEAKAAMAILQPLMELEIATEENLSEIK